MPQKLRNIIEDIARDYLESSLTLRYDICTCSTCKTDMLAYVLSHVPAQYVTTEQGALHAIIKQTKVEHQAEIARAILQAIDLVGNNPRHKLKEDKNKAFCLLLDKIKNDRGLDFSHYHQDLLKRRVAIRMRAQKIENYSEYLRILIANPDEYDKLFEVLCINVSEFFRDPEVWVKVRALFAQLVKEKTRSGENTIKVWSAGCANGEEPYTIALVLKDLLGDDIMNFSVEITATDVDKKSLGIAATGSYAKESLKNVDKKLLGKYFEPAGSEFRVKKEIKDLVSFQYLDLTSQNLVTERDAVFCRNVFIYFDRSLQEQLLMKFFNALRKGGHLVMGKSETLIKEATHIFQEVDLDSRLFKKV